MDDRIEITVLFDGDCPLCAREVRMLRRLDRARGRIGFEDIAAPGFEASRYGLDPATLMARIHGVLGDGRAIEGMEVFRRAYAAVGLGWLLAPSRWPLLRTPVRRGLPELRAQPAAPHGPRRRRLRRRALRYCEVVRG